MKTGVSGKSWACYDQEELVRYRRDAAIAHICEKRKLADLGRYYRRSSGTMSTWVLRGSIYIYLKCIWSDGESMSEKVAAANICSYETFQQIARYLKSRWCPEYL